MGWIQPLRMTIPVKRRSRKPHEGEVGKHELDTAARRGFDLESVFGSSGCRTMLPNVPRRSGSTSDRKSGNGERVLSLSPGAFA